MSTNHFFALLLVFTVSAGCSVVDRQSSSTVAETPPYLQPRSELAQSQLADMRAFHERDTAKMTEDLRAAHNREMGAFGTAGKELERDKRPPEDFGRTPPQPEKRTGWTSWFKKTENDNKKAEPPVMSSRIGGVNTTVR